MKVQGTGINSPKEQETTQQQIPVGVKWTRTRAPAPSLHAMGHLVMVLRLSERHSPPRTWPESQ